jgi:hypothetical protein
MFPVIEGSNHVPLYISCFYDKEDVLCCFCYSLFMMKTQQTEVNFVFSVGTICSKQMEIDERGSLVVYWMDFTLFAILGDGSSSIFSSLLSRHHIQLHANR